METQLTPAQQEALQKDSSAAAKDAPQSEDQSVEEALREQEEQASLTINATTARLPVELDVSVAVREFRVRNLLTLEPGQIIESRWSHGQDVPLLAGRVPLAWAEFEVVDTTMAVRVTHLD